MSDERKKVGPNEILVLRMDADGRPSADTTTAMWTDFLNGHWQRTKPLSAGVYPVANRQGKVIGEALFQIDCDGNVISLTHDNWDGWFYSRPMPLIPNRPPLVWTCEPPSLRLIKNDEPGR